MLTSLTSLVASALITAAPVAGGSLHNDWIGGDAQWFVHVDVEKLVGSNLGQFVLEHAEDLDIDLSDIEGMKEEIGIDPLTDFTAVTVYGGMDPEDDAVIIVQMNEKIDVLVEMLKMKEPSYQAIEAGDWTVHSWQDGNEMMFGHVAPGRGENDRIVTIAKDKSTMIQALRVMDDDAPSISDGDKSPLSARPRRGYFIHAAAFKPAFLTGAGDDPASHVVRSAQYVTLDIGETDDETFATANLTATDKERAKNIQDVLNGVVALGRMISNSEEAAALPIKQVLDALTITAERKTITIDLQGDPVKLLKSVMQIHEEM